MKKPTISPPSPQQQLQSQPPKVQKHPVADSSEEDDEEETHEPDANHQNLHNNYLTSVAKLGSKGQLHSPLGSAHSFDLQVWF